MTFLWVFQGEYVDSSMYDLRPRERQGQVQRLGSSGGRLRLGLEECAKSERESKPNTQQ